MTRFLLATDSVHTTAAACDYLDARLTAGDELIALAVSAGAGDPLDAEDALNVATVRLPGRASVQTATAEGDPADAIHEAAADCEADEIVMGARSGTPGSEVSVGGTARAVLARADVPVVVVPIERLE